MPIKLSLYSIEFEMPPKKKSLAFWQKCEQCGCILSAKDLTSHFKFCELPKTEWPCGYIHEKTLYGTLEDFKSRDLSKEHLKKNELKNIVLLSQSAMQICGFCIGYPVVVNTDGFSTILNSWPSHEGNLTSVAIDKEELGFLAGHEIKSSNVTVSQLPQPPSLAKKVCFRLLDTIETSINNDHLLNSLQYNLKARVIFTGMMLAISYFGKKLRLKILKVDSCYEDIAEELETLSLESKFYLTTDLTIWVNDNEKEINKTESGFREIKIGGYKSIISNLQQNIDLTFRSNMKEHSSFCILLYGCSGTGKSTIAQYLVQWSGKPVVNVQGSELFSKFYGETESKLRHCFEEAKTKCPCIVMIDNVEILGSRKGTDQERRILSCLLSMFDSIRNYPIVVLATTVDPDQLDSSLRRPGRLETEIEINIPNKEERYEILKTYLPDPNLDSILMELSSNCHGYVGADLVSLVDKAVSQAALNSEPSVSKTSLHWAFSQVRPSAMRQLQVLVPSVRWSDIGGGKEVRLKLEQAVEWPLRYPECLKRLGIKAPKGILLYGPPGCSKTLVVKALATETNLNFISIKGSDIFSKWVGESEKAIREVFRSARKVAPAIVFIDEADALGAARGRDTGSAVHDRVLSQLLTEMDGVNPLDGVVIVAATNRPDCIDKALLRPGRLDRIIYVPLPDYDTRLQIFQIQLKKMPTFNINIEELAEKTDGYSGAEVVAVCTEAALNALQEDINAPTVNMNHFHAALSIVTPRTSQSLLKLYEEYRKSR